MANQTLSAIMNRFQAVLEAAPLKLEPTKEPFSHDAQPNSFVDTAYRLMAGGLVNDRSVTSDQTVRIDRLSVIVQRKIGFDGQTRQEELLDLLDDIEQAILADGDDNSYHVTMEKGSRKVTRPKGADVMEGVMSFLVDYDYSQV